MRTNIMWRLVLPNQKGRMNNTCNFYTVCYICSRKDKKYQEQTGVARNRHLSSYIDGHKLFEIGHKEGLTKAIELYITDKNAMHFAAGYLQVCTTMSKWWESLASEWSIYER